MELRDPRPSEVVDGETLVFVYGTLLRGEPNHHFLHRARFLFEARTAPEFVLVDLGGVPGLATGGDTAVHGEVYALDAEGLAVLDELEDHPESYRRTPIRLEDGSVIESYLLSDREAALFPRISSGNWRSL